MRATTLKMCEADILIGIGKATALTFQPSFFAGPDTEEKSASAP